MVKQDLRKWQNYSYAVSPKLSATKPKPQGDSGPRRPITQSPVVEKAAGALDKYANVPQYETPISDAEGLQRAYAQGDYYIRGNTLWIAGSHTAQDWYDDVTKVPAWGDLRDSARYKAVEKVLREHPEVTNVVGHSLGGAVALELQKGNQSLKSRTYGSPTWDPFGSDKQALGGPFSKDNVERYRNYSDPFSLFDGSAQPSFDPTPFADWSFTHSYKNLGANRFSGNAPITKGPDGTIHVTE